MKSRILSAAALCILLAPARLGAASPDQDLQPFPMPVLDAPVGAADVSFLLDPPAGGRGLVTARDGHFYTGDRRIRFWGVNLCFSACFPAKEDARRVAARLAGFGVNCVRFHHMDNSPFPGGIFKDGKLEELSPEALDRLDFLIAELAKKGIYANLNLHVSRWWSRAHGWPAADRLESYDKMADLFHPDLLEAQKRYARDLLGHKNAYTLRRYAEEPSVALVEITNEDSLFQWGSMWSLARMPEPYAGILRGQWTVWLRQHHKDDAGLRAAWKAGEESLGAEMVRDGGFASLEAGGKPEWDLERHSGTEAKAGRSGGPEGKGAVRVTIGKVSGTSWHIQLKQVRLRVEKGRFYTVRFQARADREKEVGVNMGQDDSPWENLGLSSTARLGNAWKPFLFGFTARASEENGRVSFALGDGDPAVEIAGVSLRPGGRRALLEGESLAEGTVDLFPSAGEFTEARIDDRLRFLRDTEMAYFTGMRKFLRDELGVRQPITGTIAFGAYGTEVQAEMDFVDQHAYWQHPNFPHRPWDPKDWVIPNVAMSASVTGGVLPGLAATRVQGKPYTITEYNHPAPLDSQAETVPMIAAFAAWQDWDGIFLFAYNHSGRWEKDSLQGFFDIDANPAKMGFLGAGALAFSGARMGAAPAARVLRIGDEDARIAALLNPTHLDAYLGKEKGFGIEELLKKRWAVAFRDEGAGKPVEMSGAPGSPALSWVREKGRERFLADGAAAKAVCGRMEGTIELTGARLEIAAPAMASILMASRDGAPLGKSKSILLVACGRVENTGMEWSADRSSVGDRWGTAPCRIEPVRGRLLIQGDRVDSVQALDGRGREAAEVPVSRTSSGTGFEIGAGPVTLWYEIRR